MSKDYHAIKFDAPSAKWYAKGVSFKTYAVEYKSFLARLRMLRFGFLFVALFMLMLSGVLNTVGGLQDSSMGRAESLLSTRAELSKATDF